MGKEKRQNISGCGFIYFTVFVTGAVILAVEIAGTRMLSPFFGVTFYIWSALILVTMLSLAAGYYAGGVMADKKPSHKIFYRIVFFAGIAVMIIPLIAPFLLVRFTSLEIRLGIILSAGIIFSPSLILLGMVTPYAVKLATPAVDILGSRAGRLYATGTLGSCLGAVFAGFILIPSIGVANLFFVLAIMLFMIPVLNSLLQRRFPGIIIFAGAAASVFLLSAGGSSAARYIDESFKMLYEAQTLYGQLNVIEKGFRRWLTIDLTANTSIDTRSGFSAYKYTYFFELMNYINPNAEEALFIGLGGGSVVNRFLDYGIKADAVELDAKVAYAAEKYFNFDKTRVSLTIDDGRRFVKTAAKKYDFIVTDVVGGSGTVPYHFFSREFFGEAKRTMGSDGIFGLNYIGYAMGDHSKASRNIYKTLKEVFNHVHIYATESGGFEHSNIVFLASDAELNLKKDIAECGIPEVRTILTEMVSSRIEYDEQHKDSIILTDNYNPIQFLSVAASAHTRKDLLDFLGVNRK